MPYRVISDASGISWQVWAVTPRSLTTRAGLAVNPMYAAGWLAFEQLDAPDGQAPERRRLAPVPPDWVTAADHEVLTLLQAAVPVARMTRRPGVLTDTRPR